MERRSAVKLGETMLFLVLVNLLIFITIAILHEAGHVVVGVIEGCFDIRVIVYRLATGGTYTAMRCPGGFPVLHAVIGSYMFILPVSLLFLALKDFRARYFGLIMLGGHLIGSYADLQLIGVPGPVSILVGLVGFVLLVLGEDRLIEHLLEEKLFGRRYKRRADEH